MPQWTPEQHQAIYARNATILVSAAAGSGKTAVLVERIVQLLREGAHLDRMLIVTFTKAAAAEMRQRLHRRLLREAVNDPDGMGQALDALESTEISTIHAFCQRVIRNYFQVVGIDPMFRACEEQRRKLLFDEAFMDALNALLEEGTDEPLLDLANAWDQGRLHDMTVELYDFLMSIAEPFDWLHRAIERVDTRPYQLHPWYQELLRQAELDIEGMEELLSAMSAMLEEPDAVDIRRETWRSDQEAYQALRDGVAAHGEKMLQALDAFSLAKAKAARNTTEEQKAWLDRYKKLRERFAGIPKKARENLTLDEERTGRELRQIQRHLRGLESLVRRTHEIFLEKKAKLNVIDFADMEQFTLQILSEPTCRDALRGEYDHIFVDECQDVSQVQDAILQSVHGPDNCIFMVGDVKQSIYRFRKADPTIFLTRLRTFSRAEDAECRAIVLQKNFRSCENVLDMTNRVFRRTMRREVTELDYLPEDELICGRDAAGDAPVELHLLNVSAGEDGEEVEALEAETRVVIERIQALLQEEIEENGIRRRYTYRDMVILLSSAANTAPRIVELMNQAGIPVYYDGAENYFSLPEVQAVQALLSVIDNPLRDVPLLAVLRHPPFQLTDGELAEIRLCKTGQDVPFYEAFEACCGKPGALGDKCRRAREQLADWRFQAETKPLSAFIWQVMNESGMYAACGARPKGELRQANLRMLYQRAMQYEQNGGETLSGFLTQTAQQALAGDSTAAKMLGEGENLVRIMTMHKSKGLEFPIVFCMQISGPLHHAARGELLAHTRLGVALPYVNREMNIKRKTMADEAFRARRLLDEKAERARLLYVAMTRAKERLMLVGCCKESARDIWRMTPGNYAVFSARSMCDWIMQTVTEEKKLEQSTLSTSYPQDHAPFRVFYHAGEAVTAVDQALDSCKTMSWLSARLAERPENPDALTFPAEVGQRETMKTSVTALVRQEREQMRPLLGKEEEEIEDKREPERVVTPLRLSEVPARPAFMEQRHQTGAERGTLMHRVLSLVSLEDIRLAPDLGQGVQTAIHRLVERDILSGEELFVVDMSAIVSFFASSLGQRMLKSEKVRREWGFNLRLEGGTLLQGVLDCAFMEPGKWIILDYKTDRITSMDDLASRYALQLQWYARALQEISGQPVQGKYLYSLYLGKAIEIP